MSWRRSDAPVRTGNPPAGQADAMTQTQLSTAGAGPAKVPAVSLSGVTKRFGDVEAVRGIDLELQQGEIVAFLGPNGAGKTTTIDMVLGLSRPSAGEVRV